MGPLLFSLYTSVLTLFIDFGDSYFCADDTQIMYRLELQHFLKLSEQYSLIINPFKYKLILFRESFESTLQQEVVVKLNVFINDKKLELVDCAKNFGVLIQVTF